MSRLYRTDCNQNGDCNTNINKYANNDGDTGKHVDTNQNTDALGDTNLNKYANSN